MKGRLAVRTIILLAIAVIVIAVALYFLVYVTNFDTLFLSNDQRILKQYATCALAYCASGAGSDEVNAVGCLKSEGGKCTLSCAQVEKELYEGKVPALVLGSTKYYCGEKATLEFEFSGISLGGTVPLTSGQMDKIATQPQWICKPLKFPSTNIFVDQFTLPYPGFNTADIQYHGFVLFGIPIGRQNCIMLDKLAADFPASTFAPEGFVSGGGCFTGIFYNEKLGRETQLYTPLLAFNSDRQKVHSSAIYLDISEGYLDTLPGNAKPECASRDPIVTKEFKQPTDEEIKQEVNKKIQQLSNEKEKKFTTIDNILVPDSLVNTLTVDQKSKMVMKSFNELTNEQQSKIAFEITKTELANNIEQGNGGYFINKCDFKTTYKGKKIKYKVWANPTLPAIAPIQRPVEDVVNSIVDAAGLLSGDLQIFLRGMAAAIFGTEQNPGGLGQISSKSFGSCSYVTLSRNLEGTSITSKDITKEAEKLQFSEPIAVSGIATANSETFPFALVEGQKIYLFFERTTGDAFKPSDVSKEIWYTVSEDGGSTWQEAKRITDYSTGIAGSEPSAAVFNGKIYIAYKEKSFGQGVKIETKNFIVVKELGGTYEKRFADVETNDRGGPAMAVFDGRLFLFYHQRAGPLIGGDFFKILYTSWDGNMNNDWQALTLVPTPKKDGVSNFLNSPNAWSMYPNALATSNGIILSYSYSAQTGQIGPFHEAFDVRAVRFDGKGTSEDLGEISVDESGTDVPNRRQGFSHLVEKNGEIFAFYDEDDIARGGKTVDPTEAEFKSHINYKKYNPDSGWDVFPTSLFETKSKALQPTPVSIGDKILLFLSSNEGSNRWDILSSVGEKKIVLTEVPSGTDIVQGISGKTDKDSYKKGETIKFAGSLTMASGKPEGKEVRIILKFGPAELLNQDAAVAADGSFVWEYALPAGVAIGTYEIVASSGGKEVSYKFTVTD